MMLATEDKVADDMDELDLVVYTLENPKYASHTVRACGLVSFSYRSPIKICTTALLVGRFGHGVRD